METKSPAFSEDAEKLRELALFLAEESEGDSNFGKTKLNKLLFYCDFYAYGILGRPITGSQYKVWKKGPSHHRFYSLLEDLEQRGDGVMQTKDHFGFQQHRLVALREPKLKGFSGEEVALIKHLLELFRPYNASEMSEQSHQLHAWKAFAQDEVIPYTAFFVLSRELTQQEKEYARGLSPTPVSECA